MFKLRMPARDASCRFREGCPADRASIDCRRVNVPCKEPLMGVDHNELRALAPIDSPDFYTGNPHPAFARIRREAPVLRYDHLNSWLVTKYEDIRMMSATPQVYSVAQGIQLNDARYGN